MSRIHTQLKQRRHELGLKQDDMVNRVGMSRQQYQRLESKGNPRLDNLDLVAKGLKLALVLIPQEKLQAVQAILDESSIKKDDTQKSLDGDPWVNILVDDEQ